MLAFTARGALSASITLTLFIAVVLLSFLLSGSTNNGAGVRALHAVELYYTTPTSTATKHMPSKIASKTSKVSSATRVPKVTKSGAVSKSRSFSHVTSTTLPSLKDRNPKVAVTPTPKPLAKRDDRPVIPKSEPARSNEQVWLYPRADKENGSKRNGSDLILDISYYGICGSFDGSKPFCTKVRSNNATELKFALFGSSSNSDKSSLPKSADPMGIIPLAEEVQDSLNSVPLIISLTLIGFAFVISLFLSLPLAWIVCGPRFEKARIVLIALGMLMAALALVLLKAVGETAKNLLSLVESDDDIVIGTAGGKTALTVGWVAIVFSGFALLACLVPILLAGRKSNGNEAKAKTPAQKLKRLSLVEKWRPFTVKQPPPLSQHPALNDHGISYPKNKGSSVNGWETRPLFPSG